MIATRTGTGDDGAGSLVPLAPRDIFKFSFSIARLPLPLSLFFDTMISAFSFFWILRPSGERR